MTTTIYGIKNCDTMKKARAWLDEHGHDYRFNDYRVDGLDAKTLHNWCKKLGWEKLLNKSSTTFRGLPDTYKAHLNEEKALFLMLGEPTLIKRPVLDMDGELTVGFRPAAYDALFNGG